MSGFQNREVEADIARLRRGGADVEALLRFLRDRGFNESQSIGVLLRVGLDLGEIHDAIFTGETWADCRERNVRLHEQLYEALHQLSQEDDGNCKIIVEEAKRSEIGKKKSEP